MCLHAYRKMAGFSNVRRVRGRQSNHIQSRGFRQPSITTSPYTIKLRSSASNHSLGKAAICKLCSSMRFRSMWFQIRRQAPAWLNGKGSSRRSRPRLVRLFLRIFLVLSIVPLILQILLAYVVGKDTRLLPPALQHAKSLLIVTAHPDDECLFFAPSILGVLESNPGMVGGLLVLSTGESHAFSTLYCVIYHSTNCCRKQLRDR